jgi:glucose/arabinose dehydrogenase
LLPQFTRAFSRLRDLLLAQDFFQRMKQFVAARISDGGGEQRRKAEQKVAATSAAFKLTSSGTVERELPTGGATPSHGELDWSPDGKYIAFAGQSGIYLLSLEDTTVRRITEPPPTRIGGHHFRRMVRR